MSESERKKEFRNNPEKNNRKEWRYVGDENWQVLAVD